MEHGVEGERRRTDGWMDGWMGYFVKGNVGEQSFHVLDTADWDTSHSHVPHHTLVITVISPVCCKIKRNRQSLLPCRQVLLVKLVGFFGGGKTCILSDCL